MSTVIDHGVESADHDTDAPSRRRSPWVRRAIAGGCVVALMGVGFGLSRSPLMQISEVKLVGARTVPAATIQAQLNVPEGQPLATFDVDAARERIQAIPKIATVDVRRGWPDSLVVVVTERSAVAVAKVPEGWAVIDASGTPFEILPKPGNLPVLERMPRAAQPAAVAVIGSLPADLRKQVRQVTAASPESITLALRNGAQVRWGTAQDSELKARVLRSLLRQDAKVYDLMAPMLPTTRGGKPDDKTNQKWP